MPKFRKKPVRYTGSRVSFSEIYEPSGPAGEPDRMAGIMFPDVDVEVLKADLHSVSLIDDGFVLRSGDSPP
jgi:hypothetical protein